MEVLEPTIKIGSDPRLILAENLLSFKDPRDTAKPRPLLDDAFGGCLDAGPACSKPDPGIANAFDFNAPINKNFYNPFSDSESEGLPLKHRGGTSQVDSMMPERKGGD